MLVLISKSYRKRYSSRHQNHVTWKILAINFTSWFLYNFGCRETSQKVDVKAACGLKRGKITFAEVMVEP